MNNMVDAFNITGYSDIISVAGNSSVECHNDAWLRSVLYAIRWSFLPVIIGGTVTNCLNFIVLSHKEMRTSSTGVYLTALTAADLGVMYFELFRVWFEWIQLVPPRLYFTDAYCKLANYSTGVSRDYSNWLIACLTLERVVLLMSPHHARRLCTVKLAHKVVILLLLLICLPHLHTVVFSKAQKRIGWVCWEDPDSLIGQILAAAVEFTIGYIVIVVVFALNLLMIAALYRHHSPDTAQQADPASRRSRRSRRTANRRLTRTLLVVALVFLICETPRIITSFLSKFVQRTPTRRIIHNISFFISGLNHASNFFIYVFSSPRFRQLFLQTCHLGSTRRLTEISGRTSVRRSSTQHWLLHPQERLELPTLPARPQSAAEKLSNAECSKNFYVRVKLELYVHSNSDINTPC